MELEGRERVGVGVGRLMPPVSLVTRLKHGFVESEGAQISGFIASTKLGRKHPRESSGDRPFARKARYGKTTPVGLKATNFTLL